MFDLTKTYFITNDTEYEVALFIINKDLIDYDYLSQEAKKLYNTLSLKEKELIKKTINFH